jgi:phosphoribosylglycinamide formyltransferase-1
MKQIIFDPARSGRQMTIACFISGSGTNYREIAKAGPEHHYLVFTNRPDCAGVAIARANGHEVIELSHVPYLREAKVKYGLGGVPRNCPDRVSYEKELCRLMETRLGRRPDLICLAGFDQWLTDWMVDRYFPHLLNIHPGDTTRGYDGLYWTPSAKAILAGDVAVRSTLFLVDKGEDTGPVLAQSKPISIEKTLRQMESKGLDGLNLRFNKIKAYAQSNGIKTWEVFSKRASKELKDSLEVVCRNLQEALKVEGDWQIYPFAVHQLIAYGRIGVDGRTVFLDGQPLAPHGYRLEM